MNSKFSLKISEYRHARYIPGVGVFDSDGNFVLHTGKRKYRYSEYIKPMPLSPSKETDVEYVTEPLIWFGYLRTHYGHFLIDEMSRLWWTLEDGSVRGGGYKLPYRVICDIGSADKLPDYYIFCLKQLGIDEKRIFITKNAIYAESILVPDLSYIPGVNLYPEYSMTFQQIVKTLYPDPIEGYPENIYLSRKHLARKQHNIEIGEYLIEKIFEKNGFYIMYPEEISLSEQLAYYRSCKCLASSNGTIAHNILWCAYGTKQIIINRFEGYNSHQLMINERLHTEIKNIDCYISGSSHANCLFTLSKDMREFCINEHWIFKKNYLCEWWNRVIYKVLCNIRTLYRRVKKR